VDPATSNALRAAERAVTRLVEECIRDGPLYTESPRHVAQISRTGKWFLNAIASFRRELREAATSQGGRAS
jgi:hypothetical protein